MRMYNVLYVTECILSVSVKEKRHNQIVCENKRNEPILFENRFKIATIISKLHEMRK